MNTGTGKVIKLKMERVNVNNNKEALATVRSYTVTANISLTHVLGQVD
jgi:hypothetical protein